MQWVVWALTNAGMRSVCVCVCLCVVSGGDTVEAD